MRKLILLALLALAAVPAVALAAGKVGYYLGTGGYAQFTGSKIVNLQITCTNGNQQSSLLIKKHLTVSGGKFSFNGPVSTTDITGAKHTIHPKLKGTITPKHIALTMSFKESPAPCSQTKVTIKYYGKNPPRG